MFDAITIGSAIRDIFLRSEGIHTKRDPDSKTGADLVVPLGSKLTVDEMIFETGGGATNTAVTFARQGLRSACICRVGDDPGGDLTIEALEKEAVDTDMVIRDREHTTGYSIILTSKGGRTILVYRGASGEFKEDMIPKSKLDTKWILITSLAGNVTMLSHLVNWAEGHGINTAVIPGSQELKKGAKVLNPIFAKADVVIMNREEAAGITGVDFKEKEKVIHELCILTKGAGVITDGQYGATACDKEHFYHIGTHGNKAVDRTGAGDAFASGFVAGLVKYETVEGALELGADNASSVVNYFGAKKGILRSGGKKPFEETLKITKTRIR
jgi:ribokinase